VRYYGRHRAIIPAARSKTDTEWPRCLVSGIVILGGFAGIVSAVLALNWVVL